MNRFYGSSRRPHRPRAPQRMKSRRTISNIFSLILFCSGACKVDPSCSFTTNRQEPGDRFVSSRSSMYGKCQRWSLMNTWHLGAEYPLNRTVERKKLAASLEDALDIDQKNRFKNLESVAKPEMSWPCRPRSKKFLSSADSVLDLPGYRFTLTPDVLDWNHDDVLVAAIGRKYYKWSWRSQGAVDSSGYTGRTVICCKFDPTGELLALGTAFHMVELHHHATTKVMAKVTCKCKYDSWPITAVEWSPTGKSFATGCAKGNICVFTRDGRFLTSIKLCCNVILHLRVSPDARFIAVSSLAGHRVRVLTWPGLASYSVSCSGLNIIKTLTWHPWRTALLGVGVVTPSHQSIISLYSVPQETSTHALFSAQNYDVDTMLFSPRSGELVMSMWNSERDPFAEPQTGEVGSRVVVLSDPGTVVDEWGESRFYLDRVQTMVFSPDGSKLATATSEEDLIIWNFLPEKKKRLSMKKFWALPVILDETAYGTSFR